MTLTLKTLHHANDTTDSTNVLGVHLDYQLRWQKHTDTVVNKVCKATYLVRHLANNATCSSQHYVQHTLHRCKYCIMLWGHCSGAHRLFGLQSSIVSITAGALYREDCRQHIIQLNILTLACLLYTNVFIVC